MIPVLCLLLLSFLPFSTIAETPKPILVVPADGDEGLPHSSVSFRWKYDEDEEKSKLLEKQVSTNSLVLYEVNDYGDQGYINPKYVGDCKVTDPCLTCSLIFDKTFPARTHASSSECTEELKPNQWYKWLIYVNPKEGQRRASIAWFKTEPKYRETIQLSLDKEIVKHMDPSIGVKRHGKTHTIQSIYEEAGFKVDISLTGMPKPIYKETPTLAEILGFLRKTKYATNLPPDTYWHVPVVLFRDQEGNCPWLCIFSRKTKYKGYAFKPTITGEDQKEYSLSQVALFSENISLSVKKRKPLFNNEGECYLRTLVHEVGHAMGLEHEDGDENYYFWEDPNGMSIMNQTPDLSLKWDFRWSAKSLKHFYEEPLEELQPIKRR